MIERAADSFPSLAQANQSDFGRNLTRVRARCELPA
jgi:hypothetical protein